MYFTHYIQSVLICICTINKDYYNVHVYQFLAKRVRRSVKTVHTKVLAKKNASCINLQLPIIILKKSII